VGIPILSTLQRSGVGNYPLLDNGDVKGGWMTVPDAAARDAVPEAIREIGMHIYVVDEAKLYRLLLGGVWNEIPFGGSTVYTNRGIYNCPGTVNVRDVVYLTGDDAVDAADADDHTKQPVIGIVVQKLAAAICEVQYSGELTGWLGLVAGQTYFLSVIPGQLCLPTDPGYPSNHGDIVQKLAFARSATVLVVMIDRDFTIL